MSGNCLFKMRIKGTSLKGIINFQKTIQSNGLARWYLSHTNIQCSEVSQSKRILLNYKIDGKNLLEYTYNYKTDVHAVIFEISEFLYLLSEMKISDILKFFITTANPNVINIHVINSGKYVKRVQIFTQIQQEVKINKCPNIYSKMPVNIEPENFHSFIKIINNKKKSDTVSIKIQSPGFIEIYNESNEPQTHGILNPNKTVYECNFYIQEVKYLLKLLQCTNILNFYQPLKSIDIAPLCVKGPIKLIGDFEVYIHRSDVTVEE